MKNHEKDKRVEQTPEQRNPGLAKAQDFEVKTHADAAKMPTPGHGQHGENKVEYTALLPKSKLIPDRNDVNDRSPKLKIGIGKRVKKQVDA